jgi:hypothetical protein
MSYDGELEPVPGIEPGCRLQGGPRPLFLPLYVGVWASQLQQINLQFDIDQSEESPFM